MERVADLLRENQKLITLGRLAASIAHEINNPLESVANLLYLIEQDKPEKAAEYLRMAQRELARVVQITRQTLTFSRETSAPVRVELTELIEEVLGLYARRVADNNLRIVRQYESREQVLVLPGEMRQVLSNLISNAIEASAPHGRIVLRIREARSWATQGGERSLRLSIGDSGSGIPSAVRSHLGEPFFTTKGQSGTGLGLWITQAILSSYGSSLQIRSSVGPERHGTVASFVLPLKLRPVRVIPGAGAAEDPGTGSLHSQRDRGLRLVGHEVAHSVREPEEPSAMSDGTPQSPRLRACGD
ncbi:MAG TPA: HAMP domain-containing sensor histidine kinase [Acidobacteriaceae bacterium]|nr:HAMP domain-containing sensor histidine kinase [Acidobacteriaceae bacterium]